MKNLTPRQKFILNSLIEKGPLNVKGLSQQVDVSTRTILREVSSINEWLKEHKIRISESGGQLLLNGKEKQLDEVKELLGGIPVLWLLTQEQRQVLITAQLLLADEPVKSAYFSYQFNVVEGTINFYLDKIDAWLKVRNLNLIRKRGYGLEIEGSDWNKRSAFQELIYNYKPMNELLAFLYGSNNDYSLMTLFKTSFGEKMIDLIKGILKKLEYNNILKDNDVRYFGIFLHLLLAARRTQMGSSIELPEYLVSDIMNSNEFSFIRDVDRLFREEGMQLPDNELAYLAIHLKGDKYIYKDNREFEELGVDLEDITREVLYLAGKKLNRSINCDSQLILGLKQHFSPALYRLSMGLQVWNPITNEIKEYYPELFEAVEYACRLVFSKYNLTVPTSEVGYITMHIGSAIERQSTFKDRFSALIICPNGMSTARMLHSKLKSNFPELGRIDMCSMREVSEKIQQDYSIILSTVNIDKGENDKIFMVSPFLSKNDIERIRDHIRIKTAETGGINRFMLPPWEMDEGTSKGDYDSANDMLKNLEIKNITADNFKDLISNIVNEMQSSGVIASGERIEYLINKREEQGNVVIPGCHLALIHVRAEEIDAPYVGVYRLPNFIEMKSIGFSLEKVNTFLVMLARKNESNYILELLGKISIALVEDKKFAKVLRLGNIMDIRNELIGILNMEE